MLVRIERNKQRPDATSKQLKILDCLKSQSINPSHGTSKNPSPGLDFYKGNYERTEDINALSQNKHKHVETITTMGNSPKKNEETKQSFLVYNQAMFPELCRLQSEGEIRAASLLHPLTTEETTLIQDAVYGDGNPQQVIKRYENLETGYIDSIQRESFRRLKPGGWLNDE